MAIEPLDAPQSPPAPIEDLIQAPPPPGRAEETSTTDRRARRRATRLRARRVTRVIRRVDPWTVLKVAAVLYVCLWLVLTVAGVILWQVARTTGTLDNLEDFLARAFADTSFTINGGRVLASSLTAGAVIVFAGTGLTVLLAVLFNLVSEITGGVRVSVVELETAVSVDEEPG